MPSKKCILFSGGITMGPVAPLLAVIHRLKHAHPEWSVHWAGTRHGIEKDVVLREEIIYHALPSAKLRRYASLRTVLDLFNLVAAFFISFFLLLKLRPSLLVSSGSSVSVPLHLAGRVLRIPTLIHQQDVRPGLANKLMRRGATRITVACRESLRFFDEQKTMWIGNPVREELKADPQFARATLNLEDGVPIILFMGGGAGALQINRLVERILPQLTPFAHIIHITGKNKGGKNKNGAPPVARYHQFEFLDAEMMRMAYAAADVVVARAGFSTLTELSYLGKAAILIPIPKSHQEDNAAYFAEHSAAVAVQRLGTRTKFVELLTELLKHPEDRAELEKNIREILPSGAAQKMVMIIEELAAHA